ncbi:MAG: glycosyltransferase family 39 protein, partial [Planctomycetes bacterium]|nr:glycosyltransferase family 39 protein [Planctomycetota bacterium]
LKKPPLGPWTVAVSGALFGEVNEWTARLPSALAALGLTGLVGWWAGRWYGRAAGLAAAFVQLTSLYAIIFGRKAEVDMFVWLATTGAMFLIAEASPDESRRRSHCRWAGVYALLSVAWLAKFHYGPAMVLGPAVLYLLVQRRFRELWKLANPAGLVVFAAAVVVWPLLVLQQFPHALDVWKHETVGRAVGEMGHQPLWFYVPHILWLPLPWTPLVLWSLPASWRRAWRESDSRERFLWVWMLASFAIVTLSANKHKHYIVSALPAFSLLGGRVLARLALAAAACPILCSRRGAAVLTSSAIVAATAAAVIVAAIWPELSSAGVAVAASYGVGGCATAWMLVAGRLRMAAACAVAGCLGCFVTAMGWIVPAQDHRRQTVVFAEQIRASVPESARIAVYRMDEDPLVYYLGRTAARDESLESLGQRLRTRGRLLVITYEPYVAELGNIGAKCVLRTLAARSGGDYPKDGPLHLVEVTLPEGASADRLMSADYAAPPKADDRVVPTSATAVEKVGRR